MKHHSTDYYQQSSARSKTGSWGWFNIFPLLTVTLILLPKAIYAQSNDVITQPNRARVSAPRNSQQLIRLRGGKKIGEGRVEVFVGGRWGLVCDDFFDISDAHVICRQLGFKRGAREAHGAGSFGFGSLRRFGLDNLRCTGDEDSVFDCPRSTTSDCQYKTESAGVSCLLNYPSQCQPSETQYEGFCYSLHNEDNKTHAHASRVCTSQGGSLVAVTNQKQNDFLSDMLFAKHSSVTRWFLAGMKEGSRWRWVTQHNVQSTSYTKWRPSLRSLSGNCMVMYRNSGNLLESDYYYWDTTSCDRRLPFVCSRPAQDVGCIVDSGQSYRGSANSTRNGYECLQWNTPSLLAKGVIFAEQAQWDHNRCRNPDGDTAPWCMINDHQFDLCDLPTCSQSIMANKCEPDELTCGTDSTQCVAQEFVCDYEHDCENGHDEQNCSDWLARFTATQNRKLIAGIAEVWAYIPHAQGCAKRCVQSQHFHCQSFSYGATAQLCLLGAGLLGNVTVASDKGSAFYELVATNTQMPATAECVGNEYRCKSNQCVPRSKRCDGRNDCSDASDEANCSNFAIRLVGGSVSHEGRVEVRVDGVWGMVCDDNWNLHAANVACKQLGFRDAKNATAGGHYGRNTSISYMMDDVQCSGREQSLAECQHAGWAVHDCSLDEAAGVMCSTKRAVCTPQQFDCGTGVCVDNTWLCDKENDCSNGADENTTLCNIALEIRLVDGDQMNSGRLEVKHYGRWGSVCDDGFDDADAKVVCRMLGFNNPRVLVHYGGRFNPGSGPIWLDELGCTGAERTLSDCVYRRLGANDCEHSEDVGVTCLAEDTHTPSPTAGECGVRYVQSAANDPRKPRLARVVGGFEAVPGAFPWTAAVRVRDANGGTRHHCGATVISDRHLLTAAHCFADSSRTLSEYLVVVGDWDNQARDMSEQFMTVVNLTVYPEFLSLLEHDIAVIEVRSNSSSRGIQFTEYVQSACLPPVDTPYSDGMKCIVSGWGTLGTTYPRRLQSASLPILSQDTCSHESVYGKNISPTAFCAGFIRGGIDSCQGDSGGPFACQINDRFYLLGVISWGEGCADQGKPGIYTKVVDYLPWIQSVIK